MAIRFKQTLQIGNVRLELRARIGIGNKRSHAHAFHHATRRMNIKLTLNGGKYYAIDVTGSTAAWADSRGSCAASTKPCEFEISV